MMSGLTLEIYKAGKKEGKVEGMQQERERLLNSLVKKGKLTREEADKELASAK